MSAAQSREPMKHIHLSVIWKQIWAQPSHGGSDIRYSLASCRVSVVKSLCFNHSFGQSEERKQRGKFLSIKGKSWIQMVLTQVTHSKHFGEFKIKQLNNEDGRKAVTLTTVLSSTWQKLLQVLWGHGVTCGIFHLLDPVDMKTFSMVLGC